MQEREQWRQRAAARGWAADNLAARLLAGPWTPEAIAAGVALVQDDVDPVLVAALADLAEDRHLPAPRQLADWLIASRHFRPTLGRPVAVALDPPRFAPIAPFAHLPIPPLATTAELAAWLGLSAGELDWFADERRGQARAPRDALRHYRHAILAKPSGGMRLLEMPKPRLKAIQRRILDQMLAHVPVHDAVHGFVRRRSCLTAARRHAGEAIVASFDLERFFTSLGAPRVHGLFRNLGYPWAVARCLTGLTTTITPASLLNRLSLAPDEARALHALHARPHLPQGAPTSPALANLLAWPLDRRLHGLADSLGAQYTRYADDLVFSGGAKLAAGIGNSGAKLAAGIGNSDAKLAAGIGNSGAKLAAGIGNSGAKLAAGIGNSGGAPLVGGGGRFGTTLAAIAREEGFTLNAGKTRVMRRGTSQRVTGIVVNQHCNIERREFDALKAMLFNCVRHGPSSQNRKDVPDFCRHLDGRIAWVEQVAPRRGAKLRSLFDRIDWPPEPPAG